MADFKQGDRVAVLCSQQGGWFYDGRIKDATSDTLKLIFKSHRKLDGQRWKKWTIPREGSGEVVRDIRSVFYRGSLAKHNGALGKVTMNCNSDHEVQLTFLDGSESGLVRVDDLVEATPTEYAEAQADISSAAKVMVSVTNLAGRMMLEPTEMQPLTTIAEIKRLIILSSSHRKPLSVHLHHGSAELSDGSTLEQFQEDGLAELSGVLSELSITDADRERCLRQLASARRLATRFEAVFSSFDEASRADQELALHAASQNGLVLRHAHTALRSDRQIALQAVRSNGRALEFVSAGLKADKEVVLTAARQCCKALAFADAALRADAKFILEAGGPMRRWDPEVLQYVSQRIWADTYFVKEVARRNKSLLQQASTGKYGVPFDLAAEKHLALLVVGQNPDQLCHAAESMRRDADVVLAAVRKNGEALRHAHEELKNDEQVVIEAVRQNPQALRHAHPSLRMTGAGGHAAAVKRLLG